MIKAKQYILEAIKPKIPYHCHDCNKKVNILNSSMVEINNEETKI